MLFGLGLSRVGLRVADLDHLVAHRPRVSYLPQSNREMVTNLGLRLGRAGGAYNPPATSKFTDLSTGTQVKYGLVPLVWVAPSQVTAYLPG